MAKKNPKNLRKTRWAYAYELVPPQGADRMRQIEALLDREKSDARRDARTWAGRVVVEEQVTHILVVSDSPDQNHAVNLRLETKLKELQTEFLITAPMIVADGP